MTSNHWLQHNELQRTDRKWSRQSVRYWSTFAWRHTVRFRKPQSLRYSRFLDQYLKPGPPENAEACSVTARPCTVTWQHPDVTSATVSFAERALEHWTGDSTAAICSWLPQSFSDPATSVPLHCNAPTNSWQTTPTAWGRVLLEKSKKKSSHFMKTEGSLPCSQKPNTCPDREQNEYSPRPLTLIFMFQFNTIP